MLDFKKIQWYKSFNVCLVFYSCEFAKVHKNPFVYWSVYIFIYMYISIVRELFKAAYKENYVEYITETMKRFKSSFIFSGNYQWFHLRYIFFEYSCRYCKCGITYFSHRQYHVIVFMKNDNKKLSQNP